MTQAMTQAIGNIGVQSWPRLSGRDTGPRARELSYPPPPPPYETGRGAEPVGAPGRTARRLKAGLAALFLIALAAALAPRDAQAQSPVLTATAGNEQVTLNWTYTGSGLTGWGYKINGGTYSWAGTPIVIPASNSGTRSHTVTGLTNGTPYQFIVYAQTDANTAFRQSNQVSATPQVPAPTLISGPDNTIRTAETTTLVCYNLLSVSQGGVTYLEARQGKTAVTAHSALADASHGVEITQAPAGVTKGRGVNLSPCVNLGKGVHTVTWSWRGPDGAATAGTTSTTITITDPAPASKTVTISTASTTITEGDSGRKDVTINIKLGEGTPSRTGFDVEFVADSSTATDNTNVGTTSCSAPSSGADICYPGVFSDNAFANVEFGTNGSFKIGILGDTVNEGTGETVALRLVPNSLARSDGWTQNSNTLILTITDNDVTTTPPSAPAGLSAEAGNGQVELTWTDPEDDSITRYSLRQKKGSAAWGSWTAIPGSDADTTTHTVTGLDNDVEYHFRIRARNSGGNGPQSAVVRATPVIPATAGVTLSTTSLTVEEGSSNTYTVKLDKAPTANVTITVSGASGDVTVMGSPLTFTPSNFDTAQTITVSAARDRDTTDDTATLTHAASSDDTSYRDSLDIDDVDVTVTDTTPTFQLLTDPAAVTEGTDISLTVTSDRSISGNWPVRLTLAARSSSAFTAADIAGTLGPREFTANFGNSASTTGTVTIPTSADSTTEGAEAYRITLSERTTNVTYAVGSDATADGTLNDGTTASVPAAPTGLSATAGNGQVALSWTKPAGNITGYKLRYGKTGVRGSATWTAIAGSGANTESYTVTSLDNDAEYSFKIRAVNASGDGIATDWVMATPTAAATTPTPPTTPTLPATGGRVTVTPTALTVEEGGSGSYTVALDTEPSGEVTVTVGGASGDVTTSLASLTFTSANYNTAQTVTVMVAEDDDATTDPAVTLTHSASGGGYGSVSIDAVTVTITENDAAAVTPSAEAAVTLSASVLTIQEGSSGHYTVVLDSQPTDDVTVTIGGASGDVSVQPASLTFTRANYATAQTVTVMAAEDEDATTDPAVTLTHSASGGGYGSVSIGAVTVTITENDETAVRLSASGLTVEEGSSGHYTVVLDSQPTDEVTVTIGGASGDVSVQPASLTFTPVNYATAQTVTVTAAEDEDATPDTAVTLTHNASGGGYDSVNIGAVTVTITEDDEAGVTLSASALTLEEGNSGHYTVVLDSQPTDEVTVAIRGASGDVTASPASLLFTRANYHTAQTVTVTAARDDDTDEETVRVSHAVSGGDYDSVVAPSVTVTVTDTTAAGQVGRANRVNARVLPQVAAATLSQTLTAVTERIGAVASGNPGAALQFGALPGRTLEDEWKFLPRSEPSTPSVSEMLDGATFALPLQMSGDSAAIQPSGLAVWGRGERVSLSGTEEEVSWDGDLWSAHLGADMHIRPDLLAGAALSYGEGEVDTQTTDNDGSRIAGTYETTLTAIHPYVSHVLADGSHLWGSMGYGQGEARIREGSATRKTDLSQWSVALGGRRVLLEDSQRIAGGITRIALKGEGALAQLDTDAQEELTELTVKTTRLRLLLEGSHERALQGGATVTPALETGLRHDGGDLGSGLGLEAGASVTWRNPRAGWLAELRARSLVAHEKDRDEWGISALVRMEPAADGRGLSLTFGPEYGHTASGMESWFDYRLSPATTNSATQDDREGRLEAELGYGIGVSRTGAMALLTPYTGFSLAQSGAETFRVGARYRLGEGLSVGIEGKHQPQAVSENSWMLRAAIRW